MGQMFESCNLKCCSDKKISKNTRSSASNSEEEQNELRQIQFSRFENTVPKTSIEFPVETKNLFIEHSSNPWTKYKELANLGEGGYGIVKKVCLKNDTETIRAMKIIPIENIIESEGDGSFMDEIEILKHLEHPNIMKIYECFKDNKNVYIISEFCDQGDLLGKMEKLGSLNQIVVKILMDQIFNAIAYLHSNNIFHGDIKLENIMLYKTSSRESKQFSRINSDLNKNEKLQKDIEKSFHLKKFISKKSLNYIEDMNDYEIKVIDFGCSKYLVKKKDNKLRGIVGTSIYCSPEVIDNLYDEKSDEWACGILMYILLAGEPPFKGSDEDEIFANIKKGEYNFDNPKFANVSNNCKDLIRKLLEPNKKYRIKASDAIKHPFFTENYVTNMIMFNDDRKFLNKLLEIKPLPSKFHELIEAYLCYNFIQKEEEKKLRQFFRYLDHKDKNRLMAKDFETAFKENNISVTKEDIKKLMLSLDSDGNSSIEYQEFLRAMCDKTILYSDKNLKMAFDLFDVDKKGYINMENIKHFVFEKNKIKEEKFLTYLKSAGMDLNTKLTFEQFVDIIRNQKPHNIIQEKEIEEKNKEDA